MEPITVADLARELGTRRTSLKSFIAKHNIPFVVVRIPNTKGCEQIALRPESADLLRTLYANTKNKVSPNTYTYGKVGSEHGGLKMPISQTSVCPICETEFLNKKGQKYCGRECYTKERRTIRPSPEEKICRTCGDLLPIENFYSDKFGPVNICKTCHTTANRIRYRTNLKYRLRNLVAHSRPHRSKRRYIASTLTLGDLEKVYDEQGGLCYYTGVPLSLETGANSVSLDRREPSGIYELSNVVLTSWQVNRIKNDIPEQEFIDLCRLVANTVH